MAEPDEVLTRAKAEEIERAGVDTVFLKCGDRIVKVISNGMVNLLDYTSCYTEEEIEEIGVNERYVSRYCVKFWIAATLMKSCAR